MRPEATTFTYSHAAFTVRQIIFAPLDEPGVVMLLDVDSALPVVVDGSLPPASETDVARGVDDRQLSAGTRSERAYFIDEETGRFAGHGRLARRRATCP